MRMIRFRPPAKGHDASVCQTFDVGTAECSVFALRHCEFECEAVGARDVVFPGHVGLAGAGDARSKDIHFKRAVTDGRAVDHSRHQGFLATGRTDHRRVFNWHRTGCETAKGENEEKLLQGFRSFQMERQVASPTRFLPLKRPVPSRRSRLSPNRRMHPNYQFCTMSLSACS